MIIIKNEQQLPLPGAGIEFLRNDSSNKQISIVTFYADQNGAIFTNDADLFEPEIYARVFASGYSDYYTGAEYIGKDGFVILEKEQPNLNLMTGIGAALIFGFLYFHNRKK